MNYISYLRVSTEKQGATGLGMDAQRHIIKHFWPTIDKEFIEVKSGSTMSERPQLQQAIKHCIETGAHLVVAKLDRLTRNVDDCRAILSKLNGRLHAGDLPDPIDKFTLTLFAAFAERQREYISITTSNALQAKIRKSGKWQKKAGQTTKNGKIAAPAIASGQASRASVESKKRAAATNPNNVRARSVIKNLSKQGINLNQIANHLNQNGFQTSNGNNFTYATVQRLAI